MSTLQYILLTDNFTWTIYIAYVIYCVVRKGVMILVQIDQLLKEQRRTFYWLAKETGVSHTTLWRLKKDKAQGITFNTLEKICQTLKCQPSDVLKVGRNHGTKRRG